MDEFHQSQRSEAAEAVRLEALRLAAGSRGLERSDYMAVADAIANSY